MQHTWLLTKNKENIFEIIKLLTRTCNDDEDDEYRKNRFWSLGHVFLTYANQEQKYYLYL